MWPLMCTLQIKLLMEICHWQVKFWFIIWLYFKPGRNLRRRSSYRSYDIWFTPDMQSSSTCERTYVDQGAPKTRQLGQSPRIGSSHMHVMLAENIWGSHYLHLIVHFVWLLLRDYASTSCHVLTYSLIRCHTHCSCSPRAVALVMLNWVNSIVFKSVGSVSRWARNHGLRLASCLHN